MPTPHPEMTKDTLLKLNEMHVHRLAWTAKYWTQVLDFETSREAGRTWREILPQIEQRLKSAPPPRDITLETPREGRHFVIGMLDLFYRMNFIQNDVQAFRSVIEDWDELEEWISRLEADGLRRDIAEFNVILHKLGVIGDENFAATMAHSHEPNRDYDLFQRPPINSIPEYSRPRQESLGVVPGKAAAGRKAGDSVNQGDPAINQGDSPDGDLPPLQLVIVVDPSLAEALKGATPAEASRVLRDAVIADDYTRSASVVVIYPAQAEPEDATAFREMARAHLSPAICRFDPRRVDALRRLIQAIPSAPEGASAGALSVDPIMAAYSPQAPAAGRPHPHPM